MRLSLLVAAVALVASCATTLPSTAPLGRGPLAGPESEDAPRPVEAKRHKPDEKFEVASGTDAGATDASADGKAKKKTASSDSGAGAADAGSDASTDAATSGVFAGDYRGNDVTELHMPSMPGGKQEDPKARITVAENDDGTLAFKLIASNDGSTICTLAGSKPRASVSTISAGQSCFAPAGGPMHATVRTGTGTFKDKHLLFVLGMDLVVDAPGAQLSGTMDYRFDGTRS